MMLSSRRNLTILFNLILKKKFKLKQLETKLKSELEELKLKTEKEYNQSVQQYTKELDTVCLRHSKELDDRVNLFEILEKILNKKKKN